MLKILDYNANHLLDKIVYFSLFKHPLTLDELKGYVPLSDDKKDTALKQIKELDTVELSGDYILLKNYTTEQDIQNRIRYEESCRNVTEKLNYNSSLISKFPFVRSVAISGSVSKGVFKEDGDIDFFVITKENRLWICRTLLIAYKKIFRFNSKKYFCLNYFISEDELEIPDHNIYTSTEIAFLSPTYGNDLFNIFLKKNVWYKEIHVWQDNVRLPFRLSPETNKGLKRLTEKVLNGRFGERLDIYFMNVSLKRWKTKFPEFDDQKMNLAMRTKRNVSKHHPSNFQEKVINAFSERKNQILKQQD